MDTIRKLQDGKYGNQEMLDFVFDLVTEALLIGPNESVVMDGDTFAKIQEVKAIVAYHLKRLWPLTCYYIKKDKEYLSRVF